jgi:hypothetical protein
MTLPTRIGGAGTSAVAEAGPVESKSARKAAPIKPADGRRRMAG